MKKITYLSPTSISKFYENTSEFYMTYLADRRPPKIQQTRPMSVGSAFDAYVKSYLHERLFGKGVDPRFELTAIFEAQVEKHNRDWALGAGKHAFECYKNSGALADLMLELQGAVGTPRFEIEVRGVINGSREGVTSELSGVTFLGKPDIHFMSRTGAHVIFDWKVNGFCSASVVSPMQGYVRTRERGEGGHYKHTAAHRNAQVMLHHGMLINVAGYLEQFDKDWARQLAIYAWLCGDEPGGDFIVAVDQLACGPGGEYPRIRVAEHRLRIHRDHQFKIFAEAQHVWEVVHSDHIFRDMTKEASKQRCELLDGTAAALEGEGTSNDKWFSDTCRQ